MRKKIAIYAHEIAAYAQSDTTNRLNVNVPGLKGVLVDELFPGFHLVSH